MKNGLISGFKVAHKAKFSVEVYSTASTLHLSQLYTCPCFDVWKLWLSGWMWQVVRGYQGGTSLHWNLTELPPWHLKKGSTVSQKCPPSVPQLATPLTSFHSLIWHTVRFNIYSSTPLGTHVNFVQINLSFMIYDYRSQCRLGKMCPLRGRHCWEERNIP